MPFAVSGDSRNCGDVIMPTIARNVSNTKSQFYWHLGDLRAIYTFDEDITQRADAKPINIIDYENGAWQDFIQNQIGKILFAGQKTIVDVTESLIERPKKNKSGFTAARKSGTL